MTPPSRRSRPRVRWCGMPLGREIAAPEGDRRAPKAVGRPRQLAAPEGDGTLRWRSRRRRNVRHRTERRAIMSQHIGTMLKHPHSVSSPERSPLDNRLLGALPDVALARLRPDLESIELQLGSVLYEPGSLLRHLYFPTTSIVSLLYVMNDGGSAEIAVIGNDGLVGMSLFLGGETTSSRAIVQNAGFAYRIKGAGVHGGIRAAWRAAVAAAPLHPGAPHADGADGRMQPPPCDRPAVSAGGSC